MAGCIGVNRSHSRSLPAARRSVGGRRAGRGAAPLAHIGPAPEPRSGSAGSGSAGSGSAGGARSVPTRSAPVRLTRRGRAVLFALLVLLCAVLAALAAAPGGAADPAADYPTAVVQPDDTLWSFAARNAPSTTPYATIDEIRRLNHLDGYVIHPGQRLLLPLRR
jgi:LysM repeat protein